jgi:hypothetical protein
MTRITTTHVPANMKEEQPTRAMRGGPVYDSVATTHRRTREDEEHTEKSGEQEGVRGGEDEVEP